MFKFIKKIMTDYNLFYKNVGNLNYVWGQNIIFWAEYLRISRCDYLLIEIPEILYPNKYNLYASTSEFIV